MPFTGKGNRFVSTASENESHQSHVQTGLLALTTTNARLDQMQKDTMEWYLAAKRHFNRQISSNLCLHINNELE